MQLITEGVVQLLVVGLFELGSLILSRDFRKSLSEAVLGAWKGTEIHLSASSTLRSLICLVDSLVRGYLGAGSFSETRAGIINRGG